MLHRSILAACLLTPMLPIATASSAPRCTIRATKTVHPVDAATYVTKKGSEFQPTQFNIDRLTGMATFCMHSGDCYVGADFEMVTPCRLVPFSENNAGNCSRGGDASHAASPIGSLRSVRRMASMARTERRRAVSMTDLMSA